ncbi:endo alpha-1,4 polygalactosaminidase [Maribacter sp. HTCC2170]|uniref:endo alpha-1,4 polygalactosaminidase n=1 Tax=Maribacter sp. (strain HTCC2170 / KCCM 42371) TaxID=313603 RepID=UPI00006BD235|nr:endo alpha-1,4 polygalactosaminidase [Maribacter sp. HTCC2170]EAR02555.1 hypothetical protein FB2170_04690 [Maribacter sp. HTCC2170]
MEFLKHGLFVLLFFLNCNNSSSTQVSDSISANRDYRKDMRDFVIDISTYAKSKKSGFSVIPQNGIELVTDSGLPGGNPNLPYLEAIDANGQENLFYGYNGDNKSTSKKTSSYLVELLKVSQNAGNSILITDYCDSKKKIKNSYRKNSEMRFIPFAATERDLTNIPNLPQPCGAENSNDVLRIDAAKNFLFFLNYENYPTKISLMKGLSKSNHDALIIDLFANDGYVFSAEDINLLKIKANGGKRQVICYMSIGEAEDYRYYWDADWKTNKPTWLDEENKNWAGNYKVKYWDTNWQKLIIGSEESYLDKILASDFDGVYLDIIDGFEYYENR